MIWSKKGIDQHMAKTHLDKTLTALAGEFLVAGHLCLKGYVASLTLKNYPAVDVFCLNPTNGKQVAIQVKTIRSGKNYYIPESIDNLDTPFVFVRIGLSETVEFYVAPAKKIARLSEKERQDYLQKHPSVSRNQPRMISREHSVIHRIVLRAKT